MSPDGSRQRDPQWLSRARREFLAVLLGVVAAFVLMAAATIGRTGAGRPHRPVSITIGRSTRGTKTEDPGQPGAAEGRAPSAG